MEQITDAMLQVQYTNLEESVDAVRRIAMLYKRDSERIDKIERMAEAAAAKSGQVPYFLVLNDGEIVVTNCMVEDGEIVPQPNFLTIREAIDAAPEGK